MRLAVHRSLAPSDVTMRLWCNENETLFKMEREPGAGTSGDYIIYKGIYGVGDSPRLAWYYFIIKNDNNEVRYYGNNPEMLGGAGVETREPPWSFQITVYDASFRVPGWLRHGIIYQIFPDRFFQKRAKPLTQAEIEIKRPDYILHNDWNEIPIHGPDPRTGDIMNNDFFGGNLAGIEAKLPYLKELGVNIIYLNPIFEAYSNHRYDTGDYRKIDTLLGSEKDFSSLCAQAREMGIRVILDGVFNHTGSDSVYFNKDDYYYSIGAYQSVTSKYYKWYDFEKYPDKYKCWWGIRTLPNVVESNPDFIAYILSGKDSVVKRWLRLGASGWRLDVVDELPSEFVKEMRTQIKGVDGEAAIIGEVWEDASNKVSYGKLREYFQGLELDSVMNYVFKNALISFMLGRINAARFDREIWKISENYPRECYYSLMNLIGGHDVPRILTILSDPPEYLTRDQKALHKPTTLKQKLGIKRLKIMSLIQMTFPGTPSVYYGDEAGMAGFEDPFNRGTYPWDSVNKELLDWYKLIISLRNCVDALRTGSFTTVYAGESVYVFMREIKGGADIFGDPARDGFALIAVNRDRERAETVDIDLSRWNIKVLYDELEGKRGNGAYGMRGNYDRGRFIGGGPDTTNKNNRKVPTGPAPIYIDGNLHLRLEPLGCRLYTGRAPEEERA